MIRRSCFQIFTGSHRQRKKTNCEIQEMSAERRWKEQKNFINIESQVRFISIRAETQRRSIMTPLYG